MYDVKGTATEQIVSLRIAGHVDSNNAAQVEADVNAVLDGHKGQPVRIDMEELEYISSAGLRVLLKMRKDHPQMRIMNASSEVFEILEMTGFTQMMDVEKAYRVVSVEGCEVIGEGANGTLYRIDQDNVVKVYNNADGLDEIQHEREVAKLALVLGIPTAISYDVVRVGSSYGSVFELLDARSFSKILAAEPEKLEWCVEEYVELLKKIHSTVVPEGKLPDMKETALGWARFVEDYLPEEEGKKLLSMVEAIPKDDHMIHGDYHTKNLELTGDEVLLIDMDTLAVGHPVFELASMFNAFIGFSELDKEVIKKFQGFDAELSEKFWRRTLEIYLGTKDDEVIRQVEDKARIIGYTRLIRRLIRRAGLETEDGRRHIDWWKSELIELLGRVDDLTFETGYLNKEESSDTPEIVVPASTDELPKVLQFVEENLEKAGCPMGVQVQVSIAVEEIFVNIAQYAYAPGKGDARIMVETREDPDSAVVIFEDSGVPYNPLAKEDPDVTLSAEEREIGGLGIYMVKESMDYVEYEYKDGHNIFRMTKLFHGGKNEQ